MLFGYAVVVARTGGEEMTVEELINELMKYDPEENVLIQFECSYEKAKDVCEIDDEVVILS